MDIGRLIYILTEIAETYPHAEVLAYDADSEQVEKVTGVTSSPADPTHAAGPYVMIETDE